MKWFLGLLGHYVFWWPSSDFGSLYFGLYYSLVTCRLSLSACQLPLATCPLPLGWSKNYVNFMCQLSANKDKHQIRNHSSVEAGPEIVAIFLRLWELLGPTPDSERLLVLLTMCKHDLCHSSRQFLAIDLHILCFMQINWFRLCPETVRGSCGARLWVGICYLLAN